MKIIFIEASIDQTHVKELSVGLGYASLPRIGEMIRIGDRTYHIENIIWDYNKDSHEMRVMII